jgi:2-polyprenyl-3-methyl-5-hydroxy-6-metoxy-1,4-benzoquinol methylase
MKCPICGYNNNRVLHIISVPYQINNSKNFNIVQCSECRLAHLNPLPEKEFLSRFYESGYHKEKESFLNKFLSYLNRRLAIKELRKFKMGGKVLDIGCGRGAFLEEMQKVGYDSYGVEPSREGYEISSKIRNVKIFNCQISDCHFPNSYFDIVSLWHTLEHIPDPSALLKQIKRMLKPGGILVIEVPNFSCWGCRFFKTSWHQLDVPRHLFFFTKGSLLRLLESNGFEALKISTESFFTMALSPIKSYLSNLRNKHSLVNIFSVFLFPVVISLTLLRIFPYYNFRNCIRIYSKIEDIKS